MGNAEGINEASDILKKGGIIIFPTDTVYGIGTLPLKKSVERLYEIKKRDVSKKIIALIDCPERLAGMIDETAENMERIRNVLDIYWPGELTVIFRADREFTGKFDEGLETIGIRIPKNEVAAEIIRRTGGIILTTSANISGEAPVTLVEDINPELLRKADGIVADCSIRTGTPSTIIIYMEGTVELLREGNIKIEEIKKLMKG